VGKQVWKPFVTTGRVPPNPPTFHIKPLVGADDDGQLAALERGRAEPVERPDDVDVQVAREPGFTPSSMAPTRRSS
jgi:hypothetical protein